MIDHSSYFTTLITQMLNDMGLMDMVISVSKKDDHTYRIDISGADTALLIGYHGETLRALQYIAKVVSKAHLDDDFSLIIDCEGYKEKYEQKIIDIAKKKAEQVLAEDIRETLFPMNSYHRRLVHLYLMEHFPEIATESIGEEPNRRIIMKKKSITEMAKI